MIDWRIFLAVSKFIGRTLLPLRQIFSIFLYSEAVEMNEEDDNTEAESIIFREAMLS